MNVSRISRCAIDEITEIRQDRNMGSVPHSISQGTNVLVWNDTQKIIDEAFNILNGKGKKGNCPELWDGKGAERIIKVLVHGLRFWNLTSKMSVL